MKQVAFSLAIFGALVSFTPATASAQELSLQPSGAWTANFADDHCALQRGFGNGDVNAVLELRQYLPQQYFEVTVVAQNLRARGRQSRTGFVPAPALAERDSHTRLELADGWEGFRYREGFLGLPGVPAQPVDAEGAITGYQVGGIFQRDLLLQTGDMAGANQVMRDCLNDLVTSFGFDPAQQAARTRPARLNPEGFPFRQYRRLERQFYDDNDTNRFAAVLLIDAEGSPYRCMTHDVPAEIRSDNPVCDFLLENARFTPALDAEGNPIASWDYFSVRTDRIVTYSPL